MNGKCFLCGKDAKVCHQCQTKLVKDYKKQGAIEELEKVLKEYNYLYDKEDNKLKEKIIDEFINGIKKD